MSQQQRPLPPEIVNEINSGQHEHDEGVRIILTGPRAGQIEPIDDGMQFTMPTLGYPPQPASDPGK